MEKFIEDLYVDDTTSRCDTVEEGKKFHTRAKEIMSEPGFELRKWVTNNTDLRNFISENEQSAVENTFSKTDDLSFVKSQFSVGVNDCKKVLGPEWDIDSDEIVFRFADLVEKARAIEPTKRNILSVAASFFDPLSLISPITARVKISFQLLCKNKFEWDQRISRDIETK